MTILAQRLHPSNDEHVAAMECSGEHDSQVEPYERYNDYPGMQYPCAKCAYAEVADWDLGGPEPPTSMRRCAQPDCECVVHVECAVDGCCPHCDLLQRDLVAARSMIARADGMTIAQALGQLAASTRRSQGIAE